MKSVEKDIVVSDVDTGGVGGLLPANNNSEDHLVVDDAQKKVILCQSSQQVLYLANEIEDDMGASAMSLDQNSLSILSAALRSFHGPS